MWGDLFGFDDEKGPPILVNLIGSGIV